MCCFCFFFKQKTADEMRISDWSSDVCSSDLLIDGKTLTEQADETTGITQRVVTEYRAATRSKEDLRPRLTLLDKDSGEAGRYIVAPGAVISVEDCAEVKAGDVLARVARESAKTSDITGGLPRVAELFEASKPHANAILAKITGRVVSGKDKKDNGHH